MITAENLSFRYGDRMILAGVGVATRPGLVTGLIGPNGSGKSTLLRCLYGALRPFAGTVLLDDLDVGTQSPRLIAQRVGVVPQDGVGSRGLSVAEAVLLGRSPHRRDHQSFTCDDRTIVAEALEQVGALELASRRIGELSGGERQRVLVARCLAQRAPIMLLDEPTNHLDIRYQHEVLGLVRSLGLTTIVVLHDLNLAARYCDHLLLLDNCVVVAEGDTRSVLEPNVLEPVYGITVRRIETDGELLLAFGPRRQPTENFGTFKAE